MSRNVFLTHGEDEGLTGLRARLSALHPPERIIIPQLDDAFELTHSGASQINHQTPRRLAPEKVAHLDWHNDLSKLLLDINDEMGKQADEQGRAKMIRRLRRALEAECVDERAAT